jgi:hypothetical protein
MPFQSEAQRRFMYAKHPEIARRWSAEYPNQGPLPARVKVTNALVKRKVGK